MASVKRVCLYCGSTFFVEPWRAKAKYCSPNCYQQGGRKPRKEVELECGYCGEKYTVPLYRKDTSRFCSPSCTNKGTFKDRSAAQLKVVIKHGMKGTPEYLCWCGMKARCRHVEWYVRNKVKVCAEWQTDFMAFYNYMGPIPGAGYTVDRYPNNLGNYEPGNVRWATKSEQGWSKEGTKHSQDWKKEASLRSRGTANAFARLTEDKVREIRAFAGKESREETGKRFGVSRRTVLGIQKRTSWRHVK